MVSLSLRENLFLFPIIYFFVVIMLFQIFFQNLIL